MLFDQIAVISGFENAANEQMRDQNGMKLSKLVADAYSSQRK